MRRIRRCTALLTGFLVLQATLAAGGLACVAHAHGGGVTRGNAAGHHAAHTTMAAGGGSTAEGRPSVTLSSPDAADAGSCHPASLLGGCASMASCGPVVLANPASGTAGVVTHTAAVPVARGLTPPTHTTAPDLPPPRA